MLSTQQPLEINLDKVVIGSSLAAVMCAFYNKFKIIYTDTLKPDIYDTVEDYGLGNSRLDAWNKHIFQLSIAGYIPFGEKVKHIRYVDNNTIKVVTKQEGVYTVRFKELYVFDTNNFMDLPPHLSKTSEEIRVLDWFKVESGDLKKVSTRFRKTKFINQIIIDHDKELPVCVVSFIKESKLEETQEHLVKIKTESKLSRIDNEINLEHVKRELYPLGKEVYEDFDNVIFSYVDEKLMYELRRKRAKIDYMKFVRIILGIANDRDE